MRADGSLPGVSAADAHDRIVLHVDNDCFYASCERLRDPVLVDEPVIVGMGFEPGSDGGAVATASYEARDHGVQSAQAISEAMERLPPRSQVDTDIGGPTAHYRPVDMSYYQECAAEVRAILDEFADIRRSVSIDEAYLDCTEQTTWEAAASYARDVQSRIDAELGLPVSIGVGPNMAVAKIASDHDKPHGLVVVQPEEVSDFLSPLPIDDLHGVGPVTSRTLREQGMERVGDIALADRQSLVDRFGERGGELHDRARGIDRRPVTPRGKPKSLSRESAFGEPTDDHATIASRIEELAIAVAERATARGATYRTIGIKIVTPPFEIHTRERSLPGPVDDPGLVEDTAMDLLEEFQDHTVRKAGVRVSNLSFSEGDQTRLGNWAGNSQDESWEGHRGSQVSLSEFSSDQ